MIKKHMKLPYVLWWALSTSPSQECEAAASEWSANEDEPWWIH